MNTDVKDINAVIIACSALKTHLDAAQASMGTDHPVIWIDRRLDEDPQAMKEYILQKIALIPQGTDTLLLAFGACGGCWEGVSSAYRMVIPKVDDCVTMMLHCGDTAGFNLKQPGHQYIMGPEFDDFSLEGIMKKLCMKYGGPAGNSLFYTWFSDYTNVDIIDTGTYGCYEEDFVEEAQKNADLIRAVLDYVPGSNELLEQLVSGRWDNRFLVMGPNEPIKEEKMR